jgi:nucleoside-diphosphate-sugar epimerase
MRALVIGAGGYLGQPLVAALRRHVDTVGAGRSPGPAVDELLDLRDLDAVSNLLRRVRPDVIVTTAYLLDRACDAEPRQAVETNLLGMANLFEAARDTGVRRVVFASSGAVHGGRDGVADHPIAETEECRPATLYGRMKVFDEWLAAHYNERFGTEIVSFRISGPYGWGKPLERFGGEMPYDVVVDAAARGEAIELPWSPETRFRFIHVADAAASFVPLALAGSLEHRVYNAPGFTLTVGELADAASATVPFECTFGDSPRPIKFVWWDTSRYEAEFDFRPRPVGDWLREEIPARRASVDRPPAQPLR